MAYAMEVCNENRIYDVLGRLHLQKPSARQMQSTLGFIKGINVQQMQACHCTDLASKIALAQVVDIKEVGVGLFLQY